MAITSFQTFLPINIRPVFSRSVDAGVERWAVMEFHSIATKISIKKDAAMGVHMILIKFN